jgi:hypothetical protein
LELNEILARMRASKKSASSYPANGTSHLFTPADKGLPRHATASTPGSILTDMTQATDNILAISVAMSCMTEAYVKFSTATDTGDPGAFSNQACCAALFVH